MNPSIKPDELKKALAAEQDVTILDVRRRADFEADSRMIPGASRKDPADIDEWSNELREGQNVVVYCVWGGSMSKSISEKLRAKNINASFIEGGIAAWKESGGDVR